MRFEETHVRAIAPHTQSCYMERSIIIREKKKSTREKESVGFAPTKSNIPRAEAYVISSRAIVQLKGIVDRPRTRENG